MSVLVCSLYVILVPLQGGGKTIACPSGKCHGKKIEDIVEQMVESRGPRGEDRREDTHERTVERTYMTGQYRLQYIVQ